MAKSVLVDTSFLITANDNTRENYRTAKKYLRYFLDKKIKMYLSAIVISEFHQKQTIAPILRSGWYVTLPFAIEHGLECSNIAHGLGNQARKSDDSRAEYRDDIKLMAQAQANDIDFIITDDHTTLARYCKILKEAGMFSPTVLPINEEFNEAWFNDNGQASLM